MGEEAGCPTPSARSSVREGGEFRSSPTPLCLSLLKRWGLAQCRSTVMSGARRSALWCTRFCPAEVPSAAPVERSSTEIAFVVRGAHHLGANPSRLMLDLRVDAFVRPRSAASRTRPVSGISPAPPPDRRGDSRDSHYNEHGWFSWLHSTSFSISFSSITATPRVFARSSFDPASEPATT